jgi:hypothetical protein
MIHTDTDKKTLRILVDTEICIAKTGIKKSISRLEEASSKRESGYQQALCQNSSEWRQAN